MKISELNTTEIKPVGLKLSQINLADIKPVVEKKPNYFQRVGQAFRESASDITENIQRGATAIQQSGREISPLQATGQLLRTGLRTAGGVAESAFAPIIEAPVVKQLTEAVVGKIAQNETAGKLIEQATNLAQKYPEQAGDIKNVVDIVSLGYAPRVTKTLAKEGKAIGSDIAQGTRVLLTPSEEVVQKQVVELFQKSIKPTAKKTLAQGQRYENDVVSALKTIKANIDNINIEDDLGELVTGRTPNSINELAQSLDQTKRLVFQQYDDLARQAGTGGATIDARPIAQEVATVAQNKALQITNPELIKYAEGWVERLNALEAIDTQTAQEIVKNLNNSLTAFYRNPTFESATRVSIDAGIANNFRRALDEAIEGATGQQYQALKNQYGALKAIENDVVRASMRDARKNARGLLDYTDIFTGGQMMSGILSLNPAMFTKGAVERGIKEYIKFLNDPNRAVSNMFDLLDTPTTGQFTPQSATFNYLKDPKLGASIKAVDDPLTLEARKYKSAEEFVRATPKAEGVYYHGGADVPTVAKSVARDNISRPDGAIYLTSEPSVAKAYGKPTPFKLNPKKVIEIDNDNAGIFGEAAKKIGIDISRVHTNLSGADFQKALQTDIKKAGYDAIHWKTPHRITTTGAVGDEMVLLRDITPEEGLTKSQLTDIWEKANRSSVSSPRKAK